MQHAIAAVPHYTASTIQVPKLSVFAYSAPPKETVVTQTVEKPVVVEKVVEVEKVIPPTRITDANVACARLMRAPCPLSRALTRSVLCLV
jgi:hypothetical protein